MNLKKTVIFFYSILIILSCNSEPSNKVSIGEEGKPCFENNVCKNGLNLQCVKGICVDNCSDFCKNDGVCSIEDYSNVMNCKCKKGFSGERCENADHCIDNPCVNGRCINESDKFSCECSQGFTGKLCDKVNPCDPNPCNHGRCILDENTNRFSCLCDNGYVGDLCSKKDLCEPNPCVHGSCVLNYEASSFSCLCDKGFMGDLCDNVDPCEPNPCGNGTCAVNQGRFTCLCAEGYVNNPEGICVDENCSMENPVGKCIENATCYKESDVNVYCKCNENYVMGSEGICIPSDCNGACNLCQKCVDGQCVPDGTGYKCEGLFNHRCRPRKSQNDNTPTGCSGGYACFVDPEEPTNSGGFPINENALGYCSAMCPDPKNDAACVGANYSERSNDRFMCYSLTSSYNYCLKIEDSCLDNEFRQGEDASVCELENLSCEENAYCKENLLCIRGYCSKECTPGNDQECGEHRECSANLWNDNNDPIHRCIYKSYECKNDASCASDITGQENQVCNSFILQENPETGEQYFDISCGAPKGARDFKEECSIQANSTFEEDCKSGLCLSREGDSVGFCGSLCERSVDCGNTAFCDEVDIFSNTDAKVYMCVDDSWFNTLIYRGDCNQDGGCPMDTDCSLWPLKDPPTQDSDIEYLCLGPVDTNKKAVGESCGASSECRTGLCLNRNNPTSGASRVCTEICKLDANCSSGSCTGTATYNENSNFTYCK